MRAVFAFVLAAGPALAAGVEEVRVADGDGEVRLRADGTAERHVRGRWDKVRLDEPAGWYTAPLDPRDFRRLAALPGADRFGDFKDHRLPFPMRVVRLTVVRDGRERTLEVHDRRTDRDPDPPADLWGLEMAARGLAGRLDWQPIASGVRVTLPAAGDAVREVMVRDARSNAPVAAVRTHKAVAELPVKPGAYSVEVSVLVGGRWTEPEKQAVIVEAGKYLAVQPAR